MLVGNAALAMTPAEEADSKVKNQPKEVTFEE